jgi:ankyrin repeat protein
MPENNSPYPNHLEIVRALSRALDLKYESKFLDDQVANPDFDFRFVGLAVKRGLHEPLEHHVDAQFANDIVRWLEHFFEQYIAFVAKLSLEGLSREKAEQLLAAHLFSFYGAFALKELCRRLQGPAAETLLNDQKQAIAITSSWASVKIRPWLGYVSTLSKHQTDQLRRWQSGIELPSLSSLKNLFRSPEASSVLGNTESMRLYTLFVIARVVDWFRRQKFGRLALAHGLASLRIGEHDKPIGYLLAEAHSAETMDIQRLHADIDFLADGLNPFRPKQSSDNELLQSRLVDFKKRRRALDPAGTTVFWEHWFEARFHMLSGSSELATNGYRKAFEHAYFRAGRNQETIILEALVVTAMLDRPDKNFLKKLRNAQVLLGMELPLKPERQDFRSKYDDHVEAWFIDFYRGHFNKRFPEAGAFPGVKYPRHDQALIGPILVTDELGHKKPDLRHPDRRITTGDGPSKKWPQLVYYTWLGDRDAVSALLKAGADPNKLSQSDESALLLSILALDVTELSNQDFDLSFFKAIIRAKHNHQTLNCRTQKKRLAPLHAALNTNQIAVLETLLDMGCEPDFRAGVEMSTPLYHCLEKIGLLTGKASPLKQLKNAPNDQMLLDTIRRYSGGREGLTLEQVQKKLRQQYNDPRYQSFLAAVQDVVIGAVKNRLDLDELRAMARMLVQKGADPNAMHTYPIKGYTPMMLAVENDEDDLVEFMLEHGRGSLKMTYQDNRTGREIDCRQIASYFQATKVLKRFFSSKGKGSGKPGQSPPKHEK